MLKVWLPLDGDLRNLGASNVEVTNNGATVDNSGKIGKCYYFNGSAQYLQLSKTLGNIYSGDFSWCVWLKPTDNTRGIIFSEYAASGSSGVAFELLANRVIRVYWNGSPDWNFGISIDKDEWSHVAITKKNNTIKVYVNGQYRTEKTGALSARPSTACIRLGDDYRGGTNVSYMGYMNDARIYDHALSAAEVREIAQGLVLHYKLDGGVTTAKNLIKNGYGELDAINWSNSTNFSSEVPPNHPEIKKSVYSNTTTEYIPIESTHSYKLEAYLKNSATSGTTYPSLYPYDIDKNFIRNYNCPDGFNLSTMTTLKQELKSGDTKIYVNDLSKWNANSGHYYNYAAIFSYSDSTGYIYPDRTYTQNTPAFGSSTTAKTNLDKTNNIITLNSAYSGPTKPVGTAICAATADNTNYYPFGGLAKSSLNDWTYKTATMIPNNINRLKYAKYIRYSTSDGTLHAGIKLIDLTDDIDSTIVSDSSGYGHNGEIINEVTISSNTSRYNTATYFSNSAYIKTTNFNLPSNTWTASCWYYKETNPSGFEALFCLSKNNGSDANKRIAAIPNTGRIWFKGESGSLSISSLNIASWTMLTITCDGTTVKIYENTNKIGEFSAGTQMSNCTDLVIGARSNSSGVNGIAVPYTGSISDFRIYCTPLLDTDIKLLYNMSMRVDNLGGVHTFEFNEISNEKLLKTGILQTNEFEETSTQLARLQKDKGWFSSEFIEI